MFASAETCRICDELHGLDNAWIVASRPGALAYVASAPRTDRSLVIALRRHVSTLSGLEDEELAEVGELVVAASRALRSAYDPDGLHVWTDNGELAGQDGDHMVFEVVPRFASVPYRWTAPADLPAADDDDRAAMAAAVRGFVPSSDVDSPPA